ncbi:MAG: Vitamin B12 ABC transport system substrate-binding protein BtuF [Thermoanaerobacterales bacterium 50_218]|nr:MAG: Vitamin B12 ABC transport system substrate-binding protein BtuF [Thermoanaerobacterales bacterium 50_218]
MGRRIFAISVAFFLILGLFFTVSGCFQGETPETPSGKQLTVRDDSGNLLVISKEPQRIVSLTPSNTEILFALGLEDRLVGVTTYCDYPPEAKQKPKVGDLNPSVEKIVELDPDLVVAKKTLNADTIAALRKLGIPVLCVEPESIEGVFRAIRLIARVTGTEKTGEALIREIRKQLDFVKEKLATLAPEERVKVFIEVGNEPLYTAGKNTYVDELVTLAGGINVAADVEGYQMYSSESVVEKNPDVILALDSYYVDVQSDISKRPGWEKIKAVQEGRIICPKDPDLLNRPGPRAGQAVEEVARSLYPGLFQ